MSAGFQCKQFYIAHDRCAMKVGTDGLLLGAWAPLSKNNVVTTSGNILDIGAGSGLISVMLAQRSQGLLPITAIELDSAAAEQAKENISVSPWPNSIRLLTADILAYQPTERYRLIVSNPPFFQQSMPAAQLSRHLARHTDSLPFNRLLEKAATMLKPEGVLALILPYTGIEQFITLAQSLGWQLQQHCVVFSKLNKPQRSLISFVYGISDKPLQNSQLLIHNPDGSYTAQYQQLLGDFYLKFPSSL
ncbi:tRNA1(Val) (adenine(37)-N6)-methyltransferase [Rheinheimera salexigens]|uniref:tRNA1(Val) (adenine(37)-N6)-methyltransferase n=1 Tax=Rheinheimera salexigens TaxID=1628148 RepID=A0A1E7Q4G7_9GAMM|nr:methyltransferase [Rheinheimera salexigens]OEY69094.1 methyltransferase [Rheinheimera salexigens]